MIKERNDHIQSNYPEEYIIYLPEPAYFYDDPSFSSVEAARIVASLVARWADEFEAWPIGIKVPARQGMIQESQADRAMFIDDLFSWATDLLIGSSTLPQSIGLILYRSGVKLLDQHDGVPPNSLFLLPDQFIEVQDALERAGFPRETFFPEKNLRRVIEPVERFGGIVLGEQAYSPIAWQRRDANNIAALQIPSEAERRRRLFEEGSRIANALARRVAELREPGNETNPEELAAIQDLRQRIGLMLINLAKE